MTVTGVFDNKYERKPYTISDYGSHADCDPESNDESDVVAVSIGYCQSLGNTLVDPGCVTEFKSGFECYAITGCVADVQLDSLRNPVTVWLGSRSSSVTPSVTLSGSVTRSATGTPRGFGDDDAAAGVRDAVCFCLLRDAGVFQAYSSWL